MTTRSRSPSILPEAPVPVQPGDGISLASNRRNMPTPCLKAGTPEKVDQEPIGTGPFLARPVPEGRHHPLSRRSRSITGPARPRSTIWCSPSRRTTLLCAGRSCSGANATSCPIQTRPIIEAMKKHRRHVNDDGAARPQHRLPGLQHHQEAVRRQAGAASALNMAMNKKAIIDAVYSEHAASRRRTPSRPPCGLTTTPMKDDPYDPEAAKKLNWPRPAIPSGFEIGSVGHAGAAALQSQCPPHR